MHKLKTSTKLLLLAIATSALLALLGATGIFQMHHMAGEILNDLGSAKTESKALDAVENAHVHLHIQVQEWKNILIRGNDPANFEKFTALVVEEEKKVQDFLSAAIGLMKERGMTTEDVEQVKKLHVEMGARYRQALKQFDASDPNAGKAVDKLVKEADTAISAGMDKLAAHIEQHFAERITAQIERGQASYESARLIFVALTLTGLAIAITLSVIILRDILGQLGGEPAYAAEVTRRIAGGDLTVSIETRPGDNTSLLAAMKQMRVSLRDDIVQIGAAAGQLCDNAAKLTVASYQVSEGTNQQSEAASTMAAGVEEMTASIQSVTTSAVDARNMAAEAGALSRESGGVVSNAVSEINKIADSFNHSSQLISTLSEQSGQISAIVNVIKEIANQTNLLALNAAIEAARAGEQGRGFAVVADEVRKLAERTTASTREIAEMIQTIQNGTQSAMQGMADGGHQVGEGVRMAAQAGDSMTHIEASSRKVLDAVAEISSALQEQSSTSSLFAQNVEKIAQMTEENSAAVKEVNLSAEHLEGLSGTLSSLVGRFKT